MPDEGPVSASGPEPAGATGEGDAPISQGLGQETTPEALPAGGPLRTVLRRLGQVEQATGVVLLVVILILVLAQVAQRYLPGGAAWTGEISRFGMVWVTFVLAGYLVAHDQHIAIRVVDYFLPVRVLGAVKLVGHVLVAAVCVAFMYATYDFMTHDRGQVTAAAEIPLAFIYAVVAIGFASAALRAVVTIFVVDLRELRTGEKGIA